MIATAVPNQASAMDAPIQSMFQTVHHWRRAIDQHRSANVTFEYGEFWHLNSTAKAEAPH